MRHPVETLWREVGLPEYFLGNDESNTKLYALYDAIVEKCAKIAEAEKQTFLSPEYASNQPFGSLCERFACDEVAKAIRGLSLTQAQRNDPT